MKDCLGMNDTGLDTDVSMTKLFDLDMHML